MLPLLIGDSVVVARRTGADVLLNISASLQGRGGLLRHRPSGLGLALRRLRHGRGFRCATVGVVDEVFAALVLCDLRNEQSILVCVYIEPLEAPVLQLALVRSSIHDHPAKLELHTHCLC